MASHGADGKGGRLLVEIHAGGAAAATTTGVYRIDVGLSYPSTRAPPAYHQAYQRAQATREGLHEFNLTDGEALPGALKHKLAHLGASVTHTTLTNNVQCVIINDSTTLNESHVLEMPSTIPSAGRAAMLRPMPCGRSNYIIPAGAHICLYIQTYAWKGTRSTPTI